MKRFFLLFNMTHFFTGGGLFFPWQRESPTTVMFGDIRSERNIIDLRSNKLQLTWYEKIHLCTVSLFLADQNHRSCCRLPIGPPSDRFISPVEQHNHYSLKALLVYDDYQLEHLPKESSPPHAPAGLWVAPGWNCLIWLILGMVVMMITRKMTIMAILMIETKHLLVSSGRSARLHSWSGKLWEEK